MHPKIRIAQPFAAGQSRQPLHDYTSASAEPVEVADSLNIACLRGALHELLTRETSASPSSEWRDFHKLLKVLRYLLTWTCLQLLISRTAPICMNMCVCHAAAHSSLRQSMSCSTGSCNGTVSRLQHVWNVWAVGVAGHGQDVVGIGLCRSHTTCQDAITKWRYELTAGCTAVL